MGLQKSTIFTYPSVFYDYTQGNDVYFSIYWETQTWESFFLKIYFFHYSRKLHEHAQPLPTDVPIL